jgi:hypothetical protein
LRKPHFGKRNSGGGASFAQPVTTELAGEKSTQIIICALAFPLMLALKNKFDTQQQYGGMPWTKAMHIDSWLLVAAGSFWLLERLMA